MRPLGRRLPSCRSLVSAVALIAVTGALTAHAAPSTTLTVNGDVTQSKTYDLAGLQALPPLTLSVGFFSGNTPETHIYTGTNLWNLLSASGIVTTPTVKNPILRKYVVATGTDGYQTLFSLGEINPNFGNRPDFIAYAETINGSSQPLGGNGFARVAVPEDVRGGRYVSNLASLTVGEARSAIDVSGGGVSTQFGVYGEVAHPGKIYDLSALHSLTTKQQTVTFMAGGSTETHTYVGVSLWDLLQDVGVVTKATVKNDILHKYLIATGSDGYKAVLSLGEVNPLFGNVPDMIAFGEVVNGVEEDLANNGFARLVAPGDVRGGRYVSNLVALEVYDFTNPVPEPASAALALIGFSGVLIAVRRKRKGVATA